MSRATKSRTRKSRSSSTRRQVSRVLDVKMRRYLAFVRAVVGVSAKHAAR